MNKYVEKRKHKEDKPVVAICYDFDKTLSPTDMQAQGYIQAIKYDVTQFWDESNDLAEKNDMDQNLAYMYMMKAKSEGKVLFTKDELAKCGATVQLFKGVDTWFDRINRHGEEKGVIIEHYIISSGLKEMIEGTSIAGAFEKIYASSFYFDANGVAVWPAQVVNYTNKTQFLFRIEKGTLDINDTGVNDSFEPNEIRIPFRNMIYIGDSDTDIPCMKLVTVNGGHAIAVYNPETKDKAKAYKMMRERRIKFFAAADYSDGEDLDSLVKTIIDRTKTNETLEEWHYKQKKEQNTKDIEQGDEKRKRIDLIMELDSSRSYAMTHIAIAKLKGVDTWDKEERENLFEIAIKNSQVHGVLNDSDVKSFYKMLLENSKTLSKNARAIKKIIEE